MSSKKLLVLDLDGTLIPFNFFLDSLKVLPHLVPSARTALLLLFQVSKPIVYRIFKILVIILAKALNIPIDHHKKYLRFSISASFYSTIVGLILSNLRYYVDLSLLEGLRKRRDVWKIILKSCNEQMILCVLVTGNSCEELINRLSQIIKLDYVFKAYALKKGPFNYVYTIDKYAIAQNLHITKNNIMIITDSIEDLKAFSYAQCKIWVRGSTLVKLCSRFYI
jgi:predicted HAD superfamily phosphohydrolase YqeG